MTTPKASRPQIPGYGIDENNKKGLLPWTWASDILTKTQNYYLTTVRSDGRPHVMPIWGVWISDRFYFSTGRKSVKARNIERNPNCVLCAGDASEALILEGSASKFEDKAGLKKLAAAYKKKYGMDPLGMGEPVFVIDPSVVFGQIEKTFVQTATRWMF